MFFTNCIILIIFFQWKFIVNINISKTLLNHYEFRKVIACIKNIIFGQIKSRINIAHEIISKLTSGFENGIFKHEVKVTYERTTKRLNQPMSNLGFKLTEEFGFIYSDVLEEKGLFSINFYRVIHLFREIFL